MATYYDALNRVFRLFKERRLPASAQLVMLWILQENNRVGNKGQVELSDRELIAVTGYSKETISDSKQRLKSLGLIDWVTTRGKRTIYKLPQFESAHKVGHLAGNKVGQLVGQCSRFSITQTGVDVEEKKTKDAGACEAAAESECEWLYVKVAQKAKGAGNNGQAV